ncbi:reverse transcriptase domain-containing protein [Tanacetum coccineum]
MDSRYVLLNNAGATCQRLVDKAFDKQVGRNLEVYVDDLVIKSHTEEEMLRDIEETTRRNQAVPRLGRCCATTSIPANNQRGLKPQCLRGAKTTLIRATNISSTKTAGGIDNVLVRLSWSGWRSPNDRKRHGSDATHPIAVITDQPIKQIISRPDVAGRLQKWSVMLGEHNITYRPRTSVKGQILADFLVEKPDDAPADTSVKETPKEVWTLFTDVEYLRDGTLPEDSKDASKLYVKARQYELLQGVLYRRSFLKPWLRCVRPLQADYVIREIHEGSCSLHAGPRSVVAKAMRSGYYWPTMHRDARDTIRKCKDCQIHRPVPREPQQPLTPITAPWPFYKWGIDIAGPFPEGPGKVKFLIVAMDYFTKWIEAKAVATISGTQVKKFVWNDIVCRFGLPGEIISDNGKQFSGDPFKDWCEKLNIVQRFASVKHPQSNGLVERVNRSLGEGIKARLGENNKNWLEELPHVLWAHCTMIKSSNDDTPFSLTYGTEAVISAEIGMPTYRTMAVDVVHNDEEIRLNLDLVEKRRERAAIREAPAMLKMKRYYDARVRNVAFRPGDFVYRKQKISPYNCDNRKIGFVFDENSWVVIFGDGAYKLRSSNGMVLPRTWNVTNLKK